MPKRSSKPKSRDINTLAASIVDQVTSEEPAKTDVHDESGKNPAAVALGRLGGLKGGNARAAKLSSEKRSEIAKKAAAERWKRKR